MDRPVTYRAAESTGDPALAPSFAAMFIGSGVVAALAGALYRDVLGDLGFAVIIGLAVLMGLVALAILFLLRRNVLFAIASADTGMLIRWGYGGRTRVPWDDVARVLRTRERLDSPTATLNLLVRPRHRVVFPPGEGQEELYSLCARVLDRKRPKGTKGKRPPQPPRPDEGDTRDVWADINGPLALTWSLAKLASLIVGGVFVVTAADRDDPLLSALYVAIAFVIVVPLALFPPSGAAMVVRANASPRGLTYQSVVFGTRTIPWERLAMARLYIPGQAGKLTMRFVELFDVDGGRLLIPRPRNPQFYAYIDRRLGSGLTSGSR
jgi:hypothetical protein